jgi:hypothetical protein
MNKADDIIGYLEFLWKKDMTVHDRWDHDFAMDVYRSANLQTDDKYHILDLSRVYGNPQILLCLTLVEGRMLGLVSPTNVRGEYLSTSCSPHCPFFVALPVFRHCHENNPNGTRPFYRWEAAGMYFLPASAPCMRPLLPVNAPLLVPPPGNGCISFGNKITAPLGFSYYLSYIIMLLYIYFAWSSQ